MQLHALRLKIFRYHCMIIVGLIILHLSQEVAQLANLRHVSLTRSFDFVEESSVPNFFSALALFFAGIVALVIASQHRHSGKLLRNGWYLITGLLIFLSFDEGAAIHDRLSLSVQEKLDLSGVFYIGWILPYALLLVVCLVPLARVAIELPSKTRMRLFVAATVYVFSAMGFEALEGLILEHSAAGGPLSSVNQTVANAQPLMIALATIEEAGEMLGVALAIRAMLMYLETDIGIVGLSLSKRTHTATAAN